MENKARRTYVRIHKTKNKKGPLKKQFLLQKHNPNNKKNQTVSSLKRESNRHETKNSHSQIQPTEMPTVQGRRHYLGTSYRNQLRSNLQTEKARSGKNGEGSTEFRTKGTTRLSNENI